jgi:hypothetical protein
MAKQVNSIGQNIEQMQFARNDLRVLAAIRDCGFIRANQLKDFLLFRGFRKMSQKYTYGLTNRLVNMGLADLNRRALRWNAGVFSATAEGHSILRQCSCGLEVNANPFTAGEASLEHFVTLNDMMLKFYKGFQVSYWLSDFLVRSENQIRQEQGFAKDYDAVCEIQVTNKPLTVAIEYEHTLKNRAKYSEVFKSYVNDPYVQLVIFIVDSPKWIAPFSESIKVPGRRLCFVTTKSFLTQPFNSMQVSRWNGPSVETVTLAQAMQQATENKNKEYLISHTPPA